MNIGEWAVASPEKIWRSCAWKEREEVKERGSFAVPLSLALELAKKWAREAL